ncbi:hypothetical protein CDD83_9025 [Cordyceps sp. RAO-2017]|nr:hypothetical protein CDD83_9025 [Cordyceps sp. RAO-2017]
MRRTVSWQREPARIAAARLLWLSAATLMCRRGSATVVSGRRHRHDAAAGRLGLVQDGRLPVIHGPRSILVRLVSPPNVAGARLPALLPLPESGHRGGWWWAAADAQPQSCCATSSQPRGYRDVGRLCLDPYHGV